MIRSLSDSKLLCNPFLRGFCEDTSPLQIRKPGTPGSSSGFADGMVPSLGSKNHDRGECTPCIYIYKNKCTAGFHCLFCHYFHEMPKRPGKNSRRRYQARLHTLSGAASSSSALSPVIQNDPFGRLYTV
jgi:hypothetical protein